MAFRDVMLGILTRLAAAFPDNPVVRAMLRQYRPGKPPMPIVGVYCWGLPTREIFKSPLWRLPFVVPHLETFWSFSPSDRRTPAERYGYIFGVVQHAEIEFKAAQPDLSFRWSMWPHRFGEAFNNLVGTLYAQPSAYADHSTLVFAGLAALLRTARIADPVYLDGDVEVEPPVLATEQPARAVERHRTMDSALGAALYAPAKAIWPEVLCGNWAVFGATEENRTHNSRPTEAPVWSGPGLACDIQMAPVYGNETRDPIGYPPGSETFEDQLARYKVNPADYGKDIDAVARALHLGRIKDFLLGMNGAKPGTAGVCLTWVGEGVYRGVETYTDPRYFPAWYQGAKLDYNAHPELVRAIFDACRDAGVKVVDIFAQDATRDGLDKMAAVLAAAAA